MTLTLDQLQAAFKKADNTGSNLPSNYYPFWKMNDGESATVRFLPDANKDNPFGFMVEKVMHTLEINGENKSVPCLSMYGEDCPICKVSSEYYKKDDKVNGKKYWKKRQYITQAFIVEDPLPADDTTEETHQGKVRFLTLGFQVYNVIKTAFEDGELDEVPFAYKGGTDFIIKKTPQGDYSTYAVGSRFARKSSDLTEEQLAVVEDNLGDLSELLPKNPGLEKVQGMLEAALTGGAFEKEETTTTAPAAVTTTENKEEATESEGSDEADAILEQIRARRREQNS
jgi:hypothetical protein